ncbi:LSM domain protein [Staphylococcus intermedius]|uniref:LSM domain protein n=1 Tax=Staphylococcus intermedius NCTC 11048 TaxID=1141106 RepID=A0A380G880_STAIN|nr:LSM domain protein [Staphylococcus intermedius]PCF64661.1 LSM domain protein [Staphylococcus intermedius]PCF80271.1 LSM domain protein [Staphylococcus intermedius]PCF81621.1 LSM domain protein [Staphylococcus intermedius]PCF87958.1 LSM domain protein [Staphylococcus intermedius]PCF88671.1 LSM domain protein [Staphylococcus intermedius]
MKLWTYVGKKVKIELTNGKIFTGRAAGFDDEMDNESGEDSIHLDSGKLLYDFDESQIKSIEVLD